MKAARLVVLGVALAAGGIAALLASKGDDPEPPKVANVVPLDTVEVLVAKNDMGMGQVIKDQDIGWQTWPTAAAGPSYIRQSDRPKAVDELVGAIVRTPFFTGEPIREAKVIHAKGAGFMAAILPSGMRAVSTEISPETGAGGFILPNDHVDVILTRRDKAAEKSSGVDVHVSETILSNVRVLAIDQAIEEKNGQKVVVGKTATLELTPRQAETLALSRQLGTMSLALRSLVDSKPSGPNTDDSGKGRGAINTVRFGVTTVTTPR
jgi:pilus assembly protein CpaB